MLFPREYGKCQVRWFNSWINVERTQFLRLTCSLKLITLLWLFGLNVECVKFCWPTADIWPSLAGLKGSG